MEWKAKEGLLATKRENQEVEKLYQKTQAENNLLSLHFERLKNQYVLLEKSFNGFWKVGQLRYVGYVHYT